MNVSATQLSTAVNRVKTISFGEPTVEGPRRGAIYFTGGFIRGVKFRASAFFIDAPAMIVNGFPL
jgi:hypothetical protein